VVILAELGVSSSISKPSNQTHHHRSKQYKELYLPPEKIKGLNPEQEALVDFLVLSNSDSFVGLGSSTFSVYLR